MAAPGARRFPLPAQEQSATMVPETAPAEKRRQQVSESWTKNGSIIAESNVEKKPLSDHWDMKGLGEEKSLSGRRTVSNNCATLIHYIIQDKNRV